jgi:hypothetical protein
MIPLLVSAIALGIVVSLFIVVLSLGLARTATETDRVLRRAIEA